jgi:anti-sigma-K factor RskA
MFPQALVVAEMPVGEQKRSLDLAAASGRSARGLEKLAARVPRATPGNEMRAESSSREIGKENSTQPIRLGRWKQKDLWSVSRFHLVQVSAKFRRQIVEKV